MPTSYNLARISSELATFRPGFNMTLWTASRADFEAALGLVSFPSKAFEAPARFDEAGPSIGFAQRHETTGAPVAKSRQFGAARAAMGGLFLFAVLIFVLLMWRREPGREQQSPQAVQSVPPAASVAVMPFLNMSGDPAKDYLGDGVSEEILNDLSNTPDLHVAARTSSFWFKGRSADIGEIARKLNVSAVLEGSVRQDGRRLRIVAQLISAADGFHLWSASYDRSIDDILTVQDEIARAIVAAMTTKLLPRGTPEIRYASPARMRINPDAYTAYLQGRFSMNKSDIGDRLRAADYFKQAASLEPGYADAHASLALDYAVMFSDGERRDTLEPAKEQVAVALRLDPDNFVALLADARVQEISWNWREADSALQKLLQQHPRNAEAHHIHAILFEALGLWEKALSEQRRAAELDPLVPAYRDNVGQALHFLGRYDEAFAESNRVLAVEPNFVYSLANICTYYADIGKFSQAKHILHDKLMPLYANDPNRILCAASIAYREHDKQELRRLAQFAERLYAHGSLAAGYLPFLYAFMGNYDSAMSWLEKAYDDHDYGVFYAVREPLMPAAITTTPRWRALLQRPAFLEIAKIRADILARDP